MLIINEKQIWTSLLALFITIVIESQFTFINLN
jgi:hypothetical protein